MTARTLRGVDRPVQLRSQAIRISIWAVLAAWLLRRLARLLHLLLRSPIALGTLTLVVVAVVVAKAHGLIPVLAVIAMAIGCLIVWRVRWPAGFERLVRGRLRAGCRALVLYRPRWAAAITTAGLALADDTDRVQLPDLIAVLSTRSVDRLRLRMLPGQTLDDFAAVADRVAQTFGVQGCRVRSVAGRPHLLELWLLVRDPLTTVVAPFPPDRDALVHGVPVGIAEDGSTVRLQLVGHHLLIVGATGAGKGSVLWSLLVGLRDQIAAGVVKVWALDPKGGMELALGRSLFDRFCHGQATSHSGDQSPYETSFAATLEDAVQVMRVRQDRLRGVTRLHEPSVEEPLIVVLVDELAALTGWVSDRVAKKRIETALGLLLSQGRAVGVVVVGAIQDPRKDVLPLRDLFPTRIALRLNEAEQVGLVLGPGARNRGALCDLIPDRLQGVGYVQLDGVAEPTRVRFSYITDLHIAEVTNQIRARALERQGQGRLTTALVRDLR